MLNPLTRPLTGLVSLLLALGASAAADTPAAETSVKPGINESFLAPDLAVGPFIQRFEAESREIARATAEGWRNVELVAGSERGVELPARSVDVVFLCDTYHHFEYPQSTLASIRRALRPGGLLVVVDFERIEGVGSAWLLEHVRAGKETFRAEIEQAGFRFLDEPEEPGLEENDLLRFRR